MTLFGFFLAVFLSAFGLKSKRHGGCWYFEIGENWGGFEAGLVFVVNKNPSEYIKNHEFGHAIQNCFLGFLMPFFSISSAVRYWYREFKYYRKGKTPPTEYDDFKFEGQATELGEKYISLWGN